MKQVNSRSSKRTRKVSRQPKRLLEDSKLVLKKRVPGMSLKLNKIRIGLVKIFSKTENIFLLLAIPALLVIAHITPIGWGLDEAHHARRAYQISEGTLYPRELGAVDFGGQLPQSFNDAAVHGARESQAARPEVPFFERQDLADKNLNNELSSQPLDSDLKKTREFGTTGVYSPFVYTFSAIGFLISRILNLNVGDSVFVARTLQASFFVVCCYLALRLLSKNKLKWLLFSFMLLPGVIYQAITINADSFTLAMVFLFVASLIYFFNLKEEASKTELATLGFSALGMGLTKPSYAIFVGLILFLPEVGFTNRQRMIKLKALFVGVAFALFLLFSLLAMPFESAIHKPVALAADMSLSGQLKFISSNPIIFLKALTKTTVEQLPNWSQSFIGRLGLNTVWVPQQSFILAWILLSMGALYGAKGLSKKVAGYFVATGILSAMAVVVLLYSTFNVVGSGRVAGIQGRYFIPGGILIAIGLGRLFPIKLQIKSPTEYLLFTGISGFILYNTIIVYVFSVL